MALDSAFELANENMQVTLLLIVGLLKRAKLLGQLFLLPLDSFDLHDAFMLTLSGLLLELHDVSFETFELSDHRHGFF